MTPGNYRKLTSGQDVAANVMTLVDPGYDVPFLHSPDEGEIYCICSRCLEPIGKEQIALRILLEAKPIGLEEYRYCGTCQRVGGIDPVLRQNNLVEQWRTLLDKKTPYRPSLAEVKAFVRRTRANRTKISRGYMHLGCSSMSRTRT
ncbi:MAG: hypothetical protein M3Y57_12005 [Acidobacteriota bacterium]|nr:hypothetical protein [Acidobacteriota bacterium]